MNRYSSGNTLFKIAGIFGCALLLNWAVLRFFGQNSTDRAAHSLIGILLLMVCTLLRGSGRMRRGWGFADFFVALVPCYLGTVFPDLDIALFGIGGHRNPLFHSSLSYFVLVWLLGRRSGILQTAVAGYGVGLASHLWWDVFDYGDVRWLPGGNIDRLWLGIHGLLCFTPARRGSGRASRPRIRI